MDADQACYPRMHFAQDADVPGAAGTVTARDGGGGNIIGSELPVDGEPVAESKGLQG